MALLAIMLLLTKSPAPSYSHGLDHKFLRSTPKRTIAIDTMPAEPQIIHCLKEQSSVRV